MPEIIGSPTRIETAGNMPKVVEEYFGFINSDETRVSIAHINSSPGWLGVGQRADFDEFTIVVKGTLRIEHHGGMLDVQAGQAVRVRRHEWVRYATPDEAGAECYSVCVPAFTRATVHRDY